MADNTIDTLSLEIKSNASSAEKSIEKLAESLGKLSKSVGSVNTNGIKSFANSMDVLTRSMLGIKNVNASQFTKVAKGISKFEDIDTGKIAAVSNSIKPLAQSINTLNGLTFDGKNISSFIRSLAALSSANVGNLNNVDFIGLANSIKSLTNGLAGAPDVSRNTISITNAIARLGASGDKIGKVTDQLPRLSRAMHSMINSMSGAKSVNSDILEFTRAIGSLANAGKKTETTAQNLDNLAEALKRFFRTMSMAPEVKGNIIQMTQALAQLSSSGSKVRSATTGLTSSLQGFSGISSKTRKHTFSLASAFGKFYAKCWLVIRAVGLLKKAIDISSELTEIQNVVDVTFGNMASKVEEFSKNSIQNFGMSELTTKKIASRFQAMGTAMGINQSLISNANTYLNKQTKGYVGMSDSMADVSLNLTKLTADMASFYNVEQDVVAEDLESVFTGATRPLREYGLDLTQATLQEWAMKQGLDANIDSMSQAEKTMLRYQYVLANTGAAQNDFQRTSVTWANQLRILVENFRQLGSVIGKTLIGALKPLITALNIAMSHIIAFAETVSNALGKIFGWKYESGGGGGGIAQDLETGAGAADDIAGGMENAADAAKKLKTHLLGIDELNVVEPDVGNTGGSGGTGGAGGAGGGASGGQWVKGESILEDFKSEIDTLFELGNYIRDTLIKMMESIKWDEVYEKTRGFGKGLAEFLNGLLDYDGEGRTLFGEVGKTFANTLNSIVYSAQSFATTFDFEQFGTNIADGINNFFRNFDFGALANTIDSWVQGVRKTVIKSIAGIQWKNVWNGVKEFLSEIDLETVAIIIGAITIKNIGKVVFSAGILKTLQTAIGGKISAAIVKGLSFDGIGKLITDLFPSSLIATKIGLEMLETGKTLPAVLMSTIGASFKNFLLVTLPSVITNGFASVGTAIGLSGTAAIAGGGALVVGAAVVAVAAITAAVTHWDEIKTFFTETIPSWWNGTALPFFQSIPENLSVVWENVKSLASEKWGQFLDFMQGIPNKTSEIITSIGEWFGQLPEKIGYGLGYALGTITKWAVNVYEYLKNKIPEIIENVKYNFSKMKDKIFFEIQKFITETLPKWKENIKKFFFEKIPEIIKSAVDGFKKMKDSVFAAINLFITETLPKWKNNIISFWKINIPKIIDEAVKLFGKIKDKMIEVGKNLIKGLWEGIKSLRNWIGEKISGFVTGIIDGFKKGFDTHSPSKKTEEIGKNVVLGLNNGIEKNKSSSEKTVKGLTDDLVKSLSGITSETEEIKKSVGEHFGKIFDVIHENSFLAGEFVKRKFSEIEKNIRGKTESSAILTRDNFNKVFNGISTNSTLSSSSVQKKFADIEKNVRGKTELSAILTRDSFKKILDSISTNSSSASGSVFKYFGNIYNDIKHNSNNSKTSIKGLIDKILELLGFDGSSVLLSLPTSPLSNFGNAISNVLGKLGDLFSYDGREVNVRSTIHYSESGRPHGGGGKGFAKGGFPEPATYFWAGENGVPELLGTIGGRTAVAGGNEITGIREAVFQTGSEEVRLLREQNELLRMILDKDMRVSIGDRDIVESYNRGRERMGFSFT